MMLNINPPPALQGDEQAQLQQVYRYLFRLHEQLNAATTALDTQASNASAAVAKAAGIDPADAAKLGDQYSSLVALVVKTANIVQSQMDRVVTRLKSDYVAKSEWGTYEEVIERMIDETAKNTMENFIYDAKLESLTADEVSNFDTHLEGFIVRGIIGFEKDNRTPIIGIAIGRDLLKKTEVVGGKTYEVIDTTQSMATYTADKMSFWVNGVEVAYLSNSELVVTRVIVSDSIQLGDWIINVNANDGMTIQKRIGSKLDLSDNDTINITPEKISAVADKIDLRSNEFIMSVASKADVASRVFRQDEYPTGNDGVKPHDLLVLPSTGEEYQAVEDQEIELQFAMDDDGNLYYATSNPEIYSAEMRGVDAYVSGFMVSVALDGTLGVPYGWVLVRATDVQDAMDAANAAVSIPDFERIIRFKEETGLYIGDKYSNSEVRITSASVDIMFNKEPVSTFSGNFIRLDNMQILKTQGGLAISVFRKNGGEQA